MLSLVALDGLRHHMYACRRYADGRRYRGGDDLRVEASPSPVVQRSRIRAIPPASGPTDQKPNDARRERGTLVLVGVITIDEADRPKRHRRRRPAPRRLPASVSSAHLDCVPVGARQRSQVHDHQRATDRGRLRLGSRGDRCLRCGGAGGRREHVDDRYGGAVQIDRQHGVADTAGALRARVLDPEPLFQAAGDRAYARVRQPRVARGARADPMLARDQPPAGPVRVS